MPKRDIITEEDQRRRDAWPHALYQGEREALIDNLQALARVLAVVCGPESPQARAWAYQPECEAYPFPRLRALVNAGHAEMWRWVGAWVWCVGRGWPPELGIIEHEAAFPDYFRQADPDAGG